MTQKNYILNVKDPSLIVAMLIGKNGGRSHTVGINLKLKFIYDYQEKKCFGIIKRQSFYTLRSFNDFR